MTKTLTICDTHFEQQYILTFIKSNMFWWKLKLPVFFVFVFGFCKLVRCCFFFQNNQEKHLTAKAVERAALAFERVHDVHRCDGLATSVFSISDGVTNHVLQKDFQHATRLFVDQVADAFHTTTTSQTANSRLQMDIEIE